MREYLVNVLIQYLGEISALELFNETASWAQYLGANCTHMSITKTVIEGCWKPTRMYVDIGTDMFWWSWSTFSSQKKYTQYLIRRPVLFELFPYKLLKKNEEVFFSFF